MRQLLPRMTLDDEDFVAFTFAIDVALAGRMCLLSLEPPDLIGTDAGTGRSSIIIIIMSIDVVLVEGAILFYHRQVKGERRIKEPRCQCSHGGKMAKMATRQQARQPADY